MVFCDIIIKYFFIFKYIILTCKYLLLYINTLYYKHINNKIFIFNNLILLAAWYLYIWIFIYLDI